MFLRQNLFFKDSRLPYTLGSQSSSNTLMSKQVIMMVVDGGHSMDEMHNEYASRFKLALECVFLSFQQKTFNNSNHEVGFAIFGDNEVSDNLYDDNFFLLSQPIKINMDYIRKIYKLSEASLQNQKKGGDIFRAINSAIDELDRHCKGRKTSKKMFLFTNGMGSTTFNQYHIKHELAPKLRQCDVKLNIIPINFMEGYNIEDNQVQTEIKYEEQISNAQLLMDLKAEAEDNVMIIPDEIAIDLYRRFRKREVNPVAIFKGQLAIAPDLSIEVQSFKMVRRERLKSLQKYDLNQPFNPIITKEKQIFMENTYIIQGDETNTPIPYDNQTNAYQYGPHLIPISKILETDAKWHESKNFRILGFIAKEEVSRVAFMGEVELVVATKGREHLPSQKLFTALVYGMLTTNKYAIARYVPRNSKTGVIPRLVVLMPFRNHTQEGLYLVDLPTVQDVRTYPYNSLKPCTESQRELVKDMIKKMALYHRSDQQEVQQVKIDTTFNPTRQYFFQSVFYRVFKPDDDLPPLNQNIKNYLCPELRIFDDTSEMMSIVRKQFKLTKKELSKEKQAKKKALMWKDVIENQMPPTEGSMTNSEVGAEQQLKPHKIFDESDDIDSFNPSNPLISFNRMLNNNKVDLVSKALSEMSSYIMTKSMNQILNEDLMHQMLQCVSELRRGCSEQQEQDFWDNFLDECKKDLPAKLFEKIIKEGMCYLKKNNRELMDTRKELHRMEVNLTEEFGDLD